MVVEQNKEKDKNLKKDLKEFLKILNLIDCGKLPWMNDELKKETHEEIAGKILEKLPDTKVFKLSEDVIAVKKDIEDKKIDNSEVKDIKWVKDYCKGFF